MTCRTFWIYLACALATAFFPGCSDGERAADAAAPSGSGQATAAPDAEPGAPAAGAPAAGTPAAGSPAANPPSADVAADDGLGTGFVVWESRRGGAWRLWRRDLGGEVHALTPAEPSRAHCCAHVSPDGKSLVYLSLPEGQASYPQNGAAGELRRLDLAAPGERLPPGTGQVVAPRARTYFEHRAAVWKSPRELIFIDGQGRTVLRDLDAGSSRVLVPGKRDAHGWLVDPGLSFATQGAPTFSPYDPETRRVSERAPLGGCQPYFSQDGRLGVWVAGAGGPIRGIDLPSRRQWPILHKGDERLPKDRRYLYFPMPSSDGRALAWAASDDQHDHTRADYDVFVAATDPETLELVGPPVRVSRHRATDRFPAVWLVPSERPVTRERTTPRPEVRPGVDGAEARGGPSRWPVAPRDAIFLWQTARHPNRVFPAEEDGGGPQTTLLEAKGRAFTDRWGRMVLRGGAFQADNPTMKRLFDGAKGRNELSLELTFSAAEGSTDGPAALFAFAAGERRNLILTQEGDRLKVRLRTPSTGPRADQPVVDVGSVSGTGASQHLVVSYTPGRLRAFLDGEPTADTDALKSGFFHWQPTWLRLGALGPPDGDGRVFPWPWRGTLEGVAVYDRALDAEEAAENARRYGELRKRRGQKTVEEHTVRVRLLRRAPTPSLQEIAPYREALAVFEYEVLEGLEAETVRVVHRVLLAGEETPIGGLAAGGTLTLDVEPFSAQPQLESLFLSDRVGGNEVAGGGTLYWSDRLDP